MTNPPTAYYNEIDPYAATWLRNLIDQGHIAPGVVDERSIEDLRPEDLDGFAQCHFFAGIGGWGLALRLAGWPDDRPVWTGSCPCQPFSAAGKGKGFADERHLWPAFFRLIRECRPGIVFGEQVARSAGYKWWDLVAADLEGEAYAAAAVDIGAHSVGAPHRRQRLYWAANGPQFGRREGQRAGDGAQGRPAGLEPGGDAGGMAPADAQGLVERRQCDGEQIGPVQRAPHGNDADGRGEVCGLGNADNARLEGWRDDAGKHASEFAARTASPWRDLEWLSCSDGKARPTQPGIFPLLSHGVSGRVAVGSAVQQASAALSPEEAAHIFSRVGVLRGAGNAIVPQVAAAFIRSMM